MSCHFYRKGRRTSFFCLLFMSVSLSIVTSFSWNYFVYTLLRTINGFTFPALFQIPFILSKSTTSGTMLVFGKAAHMIID